jgi:hypothetical protein
MHLEKVNHGLSDWYKSDCFLNIKIIIIDI